MSVLLGETSVWALVFSREPQLYQYNRSGPRGECGSVLIIGMAWTLRRWDGFRGDRAAWEVFLRRIYTVRERAYCEQFKNKYERYAGRLRRKKRR